MSKLYLVDIGRTLLGLSHWRVLMVLGICVVLTLVSAQFGIDAWVNAGARASDRVVSIAWSAPAVLIGLVAPGLVPGLLLVRRGFADPRARTVLAAVLAALIVNLLLKALTGRSSPEAVVPEDLLQRSQSFAFGLLRGGILEGWPSGHAMTNTALAAGVWVAWKDVRARVACISWAMWVVLAVVLGIQGEVHWFSDGVAGALLGWVIGSGSRVLLSEDDPPRGGPKAAKR